MGEFRSSIIDATLCYADSIDMQSTWVTDVIPEFLRALTHGGISAIDVGDVTDPIRFELAHRLGCMVPDTSVMLHAPMQRREVVMAREALKTSRRPRMGLTVRTDPAYSKEAGGETYSQLLERVIEYVLFGKRLGLEVELVLQDASTTESIFIARLAHTAVATGASGITLVESGHLPIDAFRTLVKRVAKATGGARMSVRCSNRFEQGGVFCLAVQEHGVQEFAAVGMAWRDGLPCPSLDQLVSSGVVSMPPHHLRNIMRQTEMMIGLSSTWQAAAASNLNP